MQTMEIVIIGIRVYKRPSRVVAVLYLSSLYFKNYFLPLIDDKSKVQKD